MQTPTHKFFNDKYVYRENAQKRADLELKKSKNIADKNSIFNSLIKNKNVKNVQSKIFTDDKKLNVFDLIASTRKNG
jgi:hypothetical protein